MLSAVKPRASMRSFDPRLVGGLETDAWVAYYRREWLAFLRAVVRLVRHTFALPWPATLYGAWLVLRANQLWAPYPDNDPDGARRAMCRFYALVAKRHRERFDVDEAARLEVEWWRVHRVRQREDRAAQADSLIDAIAALYAHVYGIERSAARPAAEQRTLAMDLSDRWVDESCLQASPLLAPERAALVRSYAALLAAVHR